MKLTLLSVVQSYLNKSSDFYVDSIFNSDVAQQAAQIAEECYYTLIQKFRDWQFTTSSATLGSVSDVTKPNYLKIPDNVQRIDQSTLSYNNTESDVLVNYRPVIYLSNESFLDMVQSRTDKLANTEIVEDFGGTKFVVYNNRHPQYCTSFNGVYIVHASYNKEQDTTLQSSKSRVVYTQEKVFLQQDDFIIPIPEHLSELYRDLVIVECYEHLLQQNAPPSTTRRLASRMASAQQQARKSGSMNRNKSKYGRN